MTNSRNQRQRSVAHWGRTALAGVAVGVLALTATPSFTPAASAHAAKQSKSVVVVQVVDRAPYGEMLATTTGLSLYTGPSCTESCLSIWPPLLMPKGKKTPLGESGLGTVKVKIGRRKAVQITYNGNPLYTFYTDTGSAVGGEGVGGFVVASATTPSSSVAFVQADDTGTINGTTTSISSGESNQVLAHDTGIGHSVVLMIQTLTDPGTETDTVTSVTSGMGTFHFVNSYNDLADFEIWVCTDTTGAADSVTVDTTTNAWDAFAVEFNAPATGFINGSGQVVDLPYLGDQSWTVSPGAAGNVAVIGVDTLDAFETGPAAPWTYYNSGYWSFFNGTSAAWQVAPSSSPLTATWVQDGGESSSQGVVLEY